MYKPDVRPKCCWEMTSFPLEQLLGRMGTEAECGLAALFLAADASFCTGVDLLLSGGAELNYGVKSQVA